MSLGGRPREYDRDKIADDLIVWAQKYDSYNLNGFCALNMIAPQKITEWAKECPRFHEAYTIAKTFLGLRREQGLNEGKVHQKAYDLNAAVYDYFLKQERREHAEFESLLSNKQSHTHEVSPNFERYMTQITASKDSLSKDNASDKSA